MVKVASYGQRLEAVEKYYNFLLPHVREKGKLAEDLARADDIRSDWSFRMIVRAHLGMLARQQE